MNLENIKLYDELSIARNELGAECFEQHLRCVFGIPCLDFVKTIVINLPQPCYADCYYCIDDYLRDSSIDTEQFLQICEMVLQEFPNVRSVSITGGSLKASNFNRLVYLIRKFLPESRISWNTNGVGIDSSYLEGISMVTRVNLHRNSIDDEENRRIFRTSKPILSIEQAKLLMGEKLNIRVTIDETFDIDAYSNMETPLYLNRLLPGNEVTDKFFYHTLKKLNISDEVDKRRRNIYLNANYQGIPVRICVGDKLATHVPNRKPTYLNVAIIHRSGIVCGSWFEDDKVIFNPYDKHIIQDENPLTLKKRRNK